LLRSKHPAQRIHQSASNLVNKEVQIKTKKRAAGTIQNFQRNMNIKKIQQKMQYLSFYCYLNAIYPFSNLLRALEILNSKRLVEFIKIYSFFQNLHLKN